jgi:hypothetical protein
MCTGHFSAGDRRCPPRGERAAYLVLVFKGHHDVLRVLRQLDRVDRLVVRVRVKDQHPRMRHRLKALPQLLEVAQLVDALRELGHHGRVGVTALAVHAVVVALLGRAHQHPGPAMGGCCKHPESDSRARSSRRRPGATGCEAKGGCLAGDRDVRQRGRRSRQHSEQCSRRRHRPVGSRQRRRPGAH